MHPSNRVTLESLDDVFTYHAPNDEQRAAYGRIREAAKDFARVVLEDCPGCADQSAALRKIREAVMTANAAIALQPPVDEETEP